MSQRQAGPGIRVIPCLDVKEGRVVKGVEFVKLRDAGDPVEMATFYDREGADELVLLDIAASSKNRQPLLDVVSKMTDRLSIPLTVGGGLRSVDDIRILFAAGANKVSISTAAISTPGLINQAAAHAGSERLVVAIDAKWNVNDNCWEVYNQGGRTATGREVGDWARDVESRGAGEILLTSMDRDGTKGGYDLPLLETVRSAVTIPIIASGGAGTVQDFVDALRPGRANAVLAASLFHFGTLRIRDVKQVLRAQGIIAGLSNAHD